MNNELMVKYEAGGQEIQLSQSDVKNFLVSGDANRVTEKEFKLFLELCKFQKLNPFLRDAYLVILLLVKTSLLKGPMPMKSLKNTLQALLF